MIERATTKSGRSRLVPLTESCCPVVEAGRKDGGRTISFRLRKAVPSAQNGVAGSTGRRQDWTATHDLRHTAASLWIAAGVDIKTVSSWLGHSTAKLTLDTYGHLMGTDATGRPSTESTRALLNLTGTGSERKRPSSDRASPKPCFNLRKRGVPPGKIRTADTRFRRAVLYPLSYEGGDRSGQQGSAWPGRR